MATHSRIRAGIVGGAGFAAGELIRILVQHPEVKLDFVNSNSHDGGKLSDVHYDLEGDVDLRFTNHWDRNVDVIFLCRGHGQSRLFLDNNKVPDRIKIIDLSQDFRLAQNAIAFGRNFVYGLPEVNREAITNADTVASPGCFATGIQLALLPIINHIHSDVHITSITGSTGAGQNLSHTSLFSWRNANISTYKVFNHQHLDEIMYTLKSVNPQYSHHLFLVPVRGPFSRGIFSSLYAKCSLSEDEAVRLFKNYYGSHPFVRVSNTEIHLKKVINTNNVFVSVRKIGEMVFIESAIDNLMKGASGQAVQSMNLMFGLDETAGLEMKACVY